MPRGKQGGPANQGFKGRGVAYWAASAPAAGQPCQKMVYIGTMDGELHGVDADTGKACAGFGNERRRQCQCLEHHQHKWKIGLIQPPAVYKDTLILGWAGLDWVYKTENPRHRLWHRRPHRRAEMDLRSHSERACRTRPAPPMCGPAFRSIRKPGLAFLPVSSPSPNYYGGDRLKEMPLSHRDRGGECRNRRSEMGAPAHPSRHLGPGHQLRAHSGGYPQGRADHSGPGAGQQDGPDGGVEPQHRRAGLSDRGEGLSGVRCAG